jgi:beta-xylosidase
MANVSSKYESADLLLKIYDLRREAKMREARTWWWTFNPKSFKDIDALWASADSAKFSMVPAYWELVSALVNNGAIDKQMFLDTNGEFYFVYLKMEPYLKDMRKEDPTFMLQMEKLIKSIPNINKTLDKMRQMMKEWNKK